MVRGAKNLMNPDDLFHIQLAIGSVAMVMLAWQFVREGSVRGAFMTALLFAPLLALWYGCWLAFPGLRTFFPLVPLAILALVLTILLLPFGARKRDPDHPLERVDERDIMFARARYREGDERYRRYYDMHPELKVPDDFTRHLPALGQPGGATWDSLNPAIADACFTWIDRVRESAEGAAGGATVALDPEAASKRLAGMAKFLGARSAGTTAVHPSHVYSHIGRGTGEWGAEIDAGQFPWALVFTVEMKEEYVGAAPLQPELADSGRQYAQAAVIALTIAEYLRSLGHPARAHIDGNYRLIMPPLAVDAGLGEIGRHSLLITPEAGSRVRIGAVSTVLPLAQSPRRSFGVREFCAVCNKCAHNCPSHALPTGGPEAVRGTAYWKMHPSRCFRFWRGVGTDCGLCVAVCPYSHPRGLLHDFVRMACSRNPLSRRIFSRLDDLFYGPRPRSRSIPEWMRAGLPAGPVTRPFAVNERAPRGE